jgi:5-enolpyruvylshikimate-3-phosphate synthase
MAFTVAALFMSDKPTLVGTLCVAKSFPEFFQILKHNNK